MKKSDAIIMALVILLDQALKAYIRSVLPVGESRDAIGSIMSLTHVENTGAAFSILSGNAVLLLAITGVCVVIGLAYMFDFHFWPVFNIADIAVCVGCGLLIIYVLFEDKDNG